MKMEIKGEDEKALDLHMLTIHAVSASFHRPG
jgi:hypothetical protein